jgi:hypothetical protein
MKKIKTIYERDWNSDRSRVLNIHNPHCEWVFAGEGIATRMLDGTCCLIRAGRLFKRREFRADQLRPAEFEAEGIDVETNKTVGWLPVTDCAENRLYLDAFIQDHPSDDGTYELVGPKINGNPEGYSDHRFIPHGVMIYDDVPRDFDSLKAWLTGRDIEGLVFHHEDGRRGKIKKRDFGLKRKEDPR